MNQCRTIAEWCVENSLCTAEVVQGQKALNKRVATLLTLLQSIQLDLVIAGETNAKLWTPQLMIEIQVGPRVLTPSFTMSVLSPMQEDLSCSACLVHRHPYGRPFVSKFSIIV